MSEGELFVIGSAGEAAVTAATRPHLVRLTPPAPPTQRHGGSAEPATVASIPGEPKPGIL